uniref:Uncharacterized protein n=1 Tax=Anopheles atroparvus TaxID=41427 RepID=A0A182IZE2_ANOAO
MTTGQRVRFERLQASPKGAGGDHHGSKLQIANGGARPAPDSPRVAVFTCWSNRTGCWIHYGTLGVVRLEAFLPVRFDQLKKECEGSVSQTISGFARAGRVPRLPLVSTVGEEDLLTLVDRAAPVHGGGGAEDGAGDERRVTVEEVGTATGSGVHRRTTVHPVAPVLVVRDGEVAIGDELGLVRLLLALGCLEPLLLDLQPAKHGYQHDEDNDAEAAAND